MKKFNKHGFKFDQYGVRVPAIVISAYTSNIIDSRVYDHSSVPATLEAVFGMQPLTQRDAQANNVTHLASLSEPRDTPLTLPDVAPSSAFAKNILKIEQLNEETESAENGNLPGFLHVVLKAEMEDPQRKSFAESKELVDTVKRIQTKAQAREYIEWRLPSLLEENE